MAPTGRSLAKNNTEPTGASGVAGSVKAGLKRPSVSFQVPSRCVPNARLPAGAISREIGPWLQACPGVRHRGMC